jgi:hypothetical protein
VNPLNPNRPIVSFKLLKLRKAAHALFDGFWKRGLASRPEMYRKLSLWTGLTEDRAHFSLFDEAQCTIVIEMLRGIKVPTRAQTRREASHSKHHAGQIRQTREKLRDDESHQEMSTY